MSLERINEVVGYFKDYKILESYDEATRKDKKILMKIGGIFQMEDEANKNNRIYPGTTWDKVFENEEFLGRLQKRSLLGEVDHPKDGGQLRRSSHVITKLERRDIDGKKAIYGESDILDTPDGEVIETLFKAGCQVGVSSRGEGSVKHDSKLGKDVVQDDFLPETWDFVTKPSVSQALPSIISEAEEKQNTSTIIKALSTLVECTDDKKVLLAAYRITEAMRGDSGGDKLVSQIEEKLSGDHVEPRGIERIIKNPKEDIMADKLKFADIEKSELGQDIIAMARSLADVEIKKTESESQKKVSELEKQIADMVSKQSDVDKKIEAAEKLIAAYQDKVKSVRGESDGELTSQLDAAKKLVASAIDRAREGVTFKKRSDAAESLIQSMINSRQEKDVEIAVAHAVEGIEDKAVKESIQAMFEGCKDAVAAKKISDGVSKLVEGIKTAPTPKKESGDPLPGDTLLEIVRKAAGSKKPVKEEKKTPGMKLMGALNERCSGRV